MSRFCEIALSLCIATGATLAADPALDGKSGLKVGEKAPEFTLQDQAGKKHSLSDFLKDGNVALVFYRSADW